MDELERQKAEIAARMAEAPADVPDGRIGKPEEVAALVAFLASDEAAFMCGSLVEITGAQAVA